MRRRLRPFSSRSAAERAPERALGGGSLEPLEVLLGVGAEVEAQVREGLLDDAPHRLAEVGHEAHQRQRPLVLGRDAAEVRVQQLVVSAAGRPLLTAKFARSK